MHRGSDVSVKPVNSWKTKMLKQRVITGVILGAIIFGSILFLPTQYLAMVFAGMLGIGAWEWTRLIQIKPLVLRILFVGLVLAFLWLAWHYLLHSQQLVMFFSTASVWWLLAAFWVASYPLASEPTKSVITVKAMAGFLVLVPAWLGMVLLHEKGAAWILYIMILMWVADSGAYFSGKTWGKRKLAPKVSPGKSWEGVFGALAASVVYSIIGLYWLNIPSKHVVVFIAITVAMVPVSVLGDLFESMIKRHSGFKDSGKILPGHGGILDRIDSLTSSVPVFVLAVSTTGLIQ
jgi:phosphatidate cytidylyltransferase